MTLLNNVSPSKCLLTNPYLTKIYFLLVKKSPKSSSRRIQLARDNNGRNVFLAMNLDQSTTQNEIGLTECSGQVNTYLDQSAIA